MAKFDSLQYMTQGLRTDAVFTQTPDRLGLLTLGFLVASSLLSATNAPEVIKLFPKDGALSIQRATSFSFKIRDRDGNLDINSLEVRLDSNLAYDHDNGGFQTNYSGTIVSDGFNGYDFVITPDNIFDYDTDVTLQVTVQDTVSNTFDETFNFHTVRQQPVRPVRMAVVPVSLQLLQEKGTAIEQNIIDEDFNESFSGRNKVYKVVNLDAQVVYNTSSEVNQSRAGDIGNTKGRLTFSVKHLLDNSLDPKGSGDKLKKGDLISSIDGITVNYKIEEIKPVGHLRDTLLIQTWFTDNKDFNVSIRR